MWVCKCRDISKKFCLSLSSLCWMGKTFYEGLQSCCLETDVLWRPRQEACVLVCVSAAVSLCKDSISGRTTAGASVCLLREWKRKGESWSSVNSGHWSFEEKKANAANVLQMDQNMTPPKQTKALLSLITYASSVPSLSPCGSWTSLHKYYPGTAKSNWSQNHQFSSAVEDLSSASHAPSLSGDGQKRGLDRKWAYGC